jgi:membrane protease YdiL (CAAX protease family)
MQETQWKRRVAEAFICSLALMLFSFFIHFRFPVKIISFAALVPVAFIIGKSTLIYPLSEILIGRRIFYRFPPNIITGLALGFLLSLFYRWYLGISLFPGSIHGFTVIAALIGLTEEIIFRGFIQGHLQNINGAFAIIFSALSHTGYKSCLFLSPAITNEVNVVFLAVWTFTLGLILGIIRHLSGNITAPASGHILFDILVYAEFNEAPWWVW